MQAVSLSARKEAAPFPGILCLFGCALPCIAGQDLGPSFCASLGRRPHSPQQEGEDEGNKGLASWGCSLSVSAIRKIPELQVSSVNSWRSSGFLFTCAIYSLQMHPGPAEGELEAAAPVRGIWLPCAHGWRWTFMTFSFYINCHISSFSKMKEDKCLIRLTRWNHWERVTHLKWNHSLFKRRHCQRPLLMENCFPAALVRTSPFPPHTHAFSLLPLVPAFPPSILGAV